MEGMTVGGLNVFTIQQLMHRKEVGNIMWKEDQLKWCVGRGVRVINISEGIYAERITASAGPTNASFKAFPMIIYKLEEDISTIARLSVDRGNPEPGSLCY